METLGMTQRDLADRTGLTVQTLNRIFKGEQLTKIEQAREMEAHLAWLKTIPVKELIERKAIPASEDKVVLLRETFRFYGVSSVDSWRTVWEHPVAAARRSAFFESSPGPTSAWLRLGQLKARGIDCKPYDKKIFTENLQAIRALTTHSPDEFVPEMHRLCAEAGVGLALVPEIKGAPWSGAAEWLTASKAMILVNLRGKSEDRFWFSFFHEAGPILHDSKKETFIDDGKSYQDKPEEKRADDFAAEILIPRVNDPEIKSARSASEIRTIAARLKVGPGIVVKRYQHLTKKWTHFNALKIRFEWSETQN